MQRWVFVTMLISVLALLPSYSFAECVYSADVSIEIEAVENKQLSPYQFPSFREGDYLALKSLRITNIGNCTLVNPDFVFQLNNSKELIDSPFCIHRYYVPENITPSSYYEIKRAPIEGYPHRYTKSIGKEEFHCFTVLDTLGRWEISAKPFGFGVLSPEFITLTSYNFKANNIYLSKVGFRVYSNLELSLLDLAKQSNAFSILAVVIATLSIITSYLLLRKELKHSEKMQKGQFEFQENRHHNNQQNLLRSLAVELETIKEDVQGYKDSFEKKEIPFYKIKLIDANFYSKNLDFKINDVATDKTKKELFKLYDKTNLINYYLELLHKIYFDPNYKADYRIADTGEDGYTYFFNLVYPRMKETVHDVERLIEEVSKLLEKDFGTQ